MSTIHPTRTDVETVARYTILRGRVVWDKENGGVVGKKGYGRVLKRGVSSLGGPLRPEKDWNPRDFERKYTH